MAARLRTSSATTAKPFPALPARAASTEALMARMPVWKATSSMALAIWVIRWALSLMPSMARERASMRVLASWMHWAISPVLVRV